MNVHFHDAAKMTIGAKTGAMIGMASIIMEMKNTSLCLRLSHIPSGIQLKTCSVSTSII